MTPPALDNPLLKNVQLCVGLKDQKLRIAVYYPVYIKARRPESTELSVKGELWMQLRK